MEMMQLELFTQSKEHRLCPYWRKRLGEWPGEVLESRHHPHTTGWSMATQGLKFATWIFKAGEMSRSEFRRWCRFNRRVRRWDMKEMK